MASVGGTAAEGDGREGGKGGGLKQANPYQRGVEHPALKLGRGANGERGGMGWGGAVCEMCPTVVCDGRGEKGKRGEKRSTVFVKTFDRKKKGRPEKSRKGRTLLRSNIFTKTVPSSYAINKLIVYGEGSTKKCSHLSYGCFCKT